MAGKKVVVGQAVVPVVADLGALKKDLDAAKTQIAQMSKLGSAAGGILAGALGGVAVAAVVKFAKESLQAYAVTEKAILRLQSTSLRYGANVEGLTDQIGDYLNAVERTTRFQDTEAADSINNLIVHTKDLQTAFELNSLAMDYAEQQNITLAQASDVLAQAFDGNDRGLISLAKSLGVTGEKAKDARFLFEELDKKTKGTATGASDLQAEWTKLEAVFGNVVKDFWAEVSPMLKSLTEETRKAVMALFGQKTDTSQQARAQENINNVLADRAKILQELAYLQEKATQRKGQSEEAQRSQMGAIEEEKQRYYELTEQLAKAEAKYSELNKAQTKISLSDRAGRNQDKIDELALNEANLEAQRELIKTSDEQAAKRSKINTALGLEKETLFDLSDAYDTLREAGIEASDVEIERAQKLTDIFSDLGGTIAAAQTEEMKKFFEAIEEGTESASDAFTHLGTGLVKGMGNAIAKVLDMYAALYAAKAAAAFYEFDFVSGAKFLAGSAVLTTASAAVQTQVSKLADGGVSIGGTATEDTIPALLRKNEAVVPLDDPRALAKIRGAMGGGGGYQVGQVTLNFPNVRDGAGVRDPRTGRTAALELMRQLDRTNVRSGRL